MRVETTSPVRFFVLRAGADVAQLVEQRFRKPQVAGSSPAVGSSFFGGRSRELILVRAGAKRLFFVAVFASVLASLGLTANARMPSPVPSESASPSSSASATPTPVPRENTIVTHHTATIAGKRIAYTATAGTLLLRDATGAPTASIFYIAFTADHRGPVSERPLTFAYNGGPGGSSALIDIGALGPRMVQTVNGAATPPAPYAMVDNTDSILDKTDLVFIDAPGTGFSRIVGSSKPKDFYGVEADGEAFAQFIRRYITRFNRWNSPKYLAGESYGTTRSVVLAKMLHDEGIDVNGLILIGTVLDFATLTPQPGNDLPYSLFLPTEAAVAAYYHKLPSDPGDLKAFLQNVRAFASGPYAEALAKGSGLSSSEKNAIAQKLHADTGLSVDYLLRSNLRVRPAQFRKQLLGAEDRTVGRYDARFSEFALQPTRSSAHTDPAANATFSAFTATMNDYVRDELQFRTNAKYIFLNDNVNHQWDWKTGLAWSAGATNVSDDLRDVLTENPYLRVFVAAGLYDMATPFYAAEYSMQHLGLAPELQSHIAFAYYRSGHMAYLNPQAHAQLKRDLDAFITSPSRR
jgi:carboxypeptidase C (cathepsin A)